jgi:hypothetical protein
MRAGFSGKAGLIMADKQGMEKNPRIIAVVYCPTPAGYRDGEETADSACRAKLAAYLIADDTAERGL